MSLPKPNIIDPSSVPALRWGVMGAAAIAQEFVGAVQKHTGQIVVAVASRTPGKAEAFAKQFGLESHDNYEDLLARDDIDVIYIPTLPTQHRDHALMAIAAGKHVLIEKPITMDVGQAKEIFAAAKAAGVLAMEAMWTRYLPQYDIARQLIADGTLGTLDAVNASFCNDNREVPRLWKKGHGDILFDMGIYPISFAQSFLGNPIAINAQGVLNADKIDEEVSVQLTYASGARAYILVSGRVTLPVIASVGGSKGHLTMQHPFFVPTTIELSGLDLYSPIEAWKDASPVVGHEGLSYQATALASYVAAGLLESPIESHADSIANIAVCAEIIRQIGAEVL